MDKVSLLLPPTEACSSLSSDFLPSDAIFLVFPLLSDIGQVPPVGQVQYHLNLFLVLFLPVSALVPTAPHTPALVTA